MTSILRSTRSRLVERLVYHLRHDTATALTGTVTTNGTTSVVGSGTDFQTDFAAGDTIYIWGEGPRTVASVESDTALTLTVAAVSTASGLAHSGAPGLFEYTGGAVGTGTIDAPQYEPRIEAWPVEAISETLRTTPFIVVQAVRPSGIFEAFPTGYNEPLYELMATLFIRTEPRRLEAGVLNSDDAYLHMRNVAISGENPHVPGKLLDPDNTARALNIHIVGINEEQPQRFKDVTLYPLRIGYVCREDIRTGELT